MGAPRCGARSLASAAHWAASGWPPIATASGSAAGDAIWVDLVRFRALLAEADRHDHVASDACPTCVAWLEEAVALYRDDFLAGFHLRDSPEFDDWRFFQAEGLRRELAGALDRLVAAHGRSGAYEVAIAHARRRLALDPLHEPAHRALMQLYEWAGQRAAALRQYQRCARVLQDELGVAPQPETTALYRGDPRRNRPATAVSGRARARRRQSDGRRAAYAGADRRPAAGRGPAPAAGRPGGRVGDAARPLRRRRPRRPPRRRRGRGRHRQDAPGRGIPGRRRATRRGHADRALLRGPGQPGLRPGGRSAARCARSARRGRRACARWRRTGWPRSAGCCPSWWRSSPTCRPRRRSTASAPRPASSRGWRR